MKESTFIKKIVEWFHTLSGTQIAVGATATGLLVAGVIGGVILADTLKASNDPVETESTEITESVYPEALFGETETTEMTEAVEDILVEITTTSIDKDLKIKIVDENGNLVKGFPFVVTITPEGEEKGKDYEDDDMDGVIHIKDLEGGEYIVLLQELKGILVEENEITATVKGQIEYSKVDVQNEIKKESQINASIEDTAQNNVAEEAPIVDTTPLVDSKVEATTSQYDNVDIAKLPAAVVSGDRNEKSLDKTKVVEILPPADTSTGGSTTDTPTTDTSTGGSTTDTPADTSTTDTPTDAPLPGGTESQQNEDGTEGEGLNSEEGGAYSARAKGHSFATTGATETVTDTSVTVSIPKTVTLYTVGTETSTTANISLGISGDSSVIKSYTWSIADANVADLVVAADNNSATLKAKTEGKTNVVIHFEYYSNVEGAVGTYDLICEVTVSKHTDNTTQLVDKDGNKLYLDEAATKPATPADLGTAAKFYKNPKFTGWQTIDGYVYYYNEEGKPVTGSQVIGGVKYEFHEDGKLKENQQTTGIDVSKWQAKIDWKAVADAGIDFAIIRCGYRGSSTGVIVEDPYFKANIQGATANGIKVGVYFFTQAITEAEAVEEASAAISWVSGYKLNFPIFIDTEGSGGRADSLGKSARTAIVKAFCETVRNSGYKPGIYASKYWYYDNLDASQLSTYNIWVAQYNTECNYKGRYDIWQYTSKGSVPGIKGNVDMNICYTKY